MTQAPAQDTDTETDSDTDPGADAGSDSGAIAVASPAVACDGGGGPLGHPRVFLRIGAAGEIVCPYCSRRFVLAEGAPADPGH
jgi:uncharacterized Zn-finger protein